MQAKTERKALAERLREARTNAGLSQGQAAVLMEMSPPTISQIETSTRAVSAYELSTFADLYAVNVDWLLGRVDETDLPAEYLDMCERLKPEERERFKRLLASFVEMEPKNAEPIEDEVK